MMILGISASARKEGITSQTIKAILENSEQPYRLISLAGKRINGCIGCTKCAGDNRCKIQDDWNEIGEAMLSADAIVFGAPNYFNTINAFGHSCLERTFCFRHLGSYCLEGKPMIAVSTQYEDNGENPVHSFIEKFGMINKMNVLCKVSAKGYSQCFTCGYGHNCIAGNVVKKYGVIEKIEKQHLPPCFEEQADTLQQVRKAADILKSKFAV